MAQRLSALRVPRISFVDRAAVRDPANPTQPRRFVMFKAEGSQPANPTKGALVLTDAEKAELDPAVREVVEKAEKDAADATARAEAAETAKTEAETELEKAKKKPAVNSSDNDADDPNPLKKEDLDPAVRAALEKAEQREEAANARIKKAEEDSAEAQKLAKEERDTRVTGEWIAKAETGELRGLPGAPADIGPVMKSLAEAAPEAWATFEKSVLTPAVAQIREGMLFKEQGKGGEGPPPDSALAKMNAQVVELQKADPNLTRAKAMERVRKSDPGLQQELAAELGSAGAA